MGNKKESAGRNTQDSLLDRFSTGGSAGEPGINTGFSKLVSLYKLEIGMTGILIAIFIILHLMTGTAITPMNLKNVLQAAAPVFLIALGQLLIVITGGIDLSVGSVFSLSGMICARVMIAYGIFPGIIAGLVTGIVCGAVNGFLVVKAKLAPFIVTLAMYSAAASLTFIATNGNSQFITRKAFALFDRGHIIPGFPNYILYIIIAVILFQIFLRKFTFGRWIYGTGSNEEAARLVGIPTNAVKYFAYMCCGGLTAIAAMMNASYLMTVECTAGNGLELVTIAAVVIGGASLNGGMGTAVGVLIGTFIQTSIRNGINLLGINSFWDGTVTGIVIIVAVLIGSGKLIALKRRKK